MDGSKADAHLDSPRERARRGKAMRKRASRSDQAVFEPPGDRPDPVQTLAAQDATRVPELVPIRYGRMLASPFAFYRGAAAIMAADLAGTPTTGLKTQLCGDAHLSNFGAFAAPDRRLVFDINDFDETLPGPFEWDVKRLAASFEIGARERGFRRRDRRAAALTAVSAYREAMRQFAAMRDIDVWYARADLDEIYQRYEAGISAGERKRYRRQVAKAREKDSVRALAKLTERRNGELRIASRPPVLVPIEDFAAGHEDEIDAAVVRLLAKYRDTLSHHNRRLLERYRYVHCARKVVGVGSVGTGAWIVLLLGRDDRDPLFLQVKEAGASVLEPYAGASRFRHPGHRVVAGQRLMQATGDILLGWLWAEGVEGQRRAFYVRQLWDGKGSTDIELMNPSGMALYAEICGWTLARAHARAGDPIAIAAYLGKGERFDAAIADFAEAYADQNQADYETLLEAEKAGAVEVERGA